MELYAIRIFVRQWPEACAFYGDALGLTERFRDDEMGWAEYDLGGPCFGIERVASGDAEGEAMVGRFVGVSLRVDDIDATYASLRDKGVIFTSPPEKQPWGGSLAHFQDPDGNVLTLLG
ncbi:MAG: VOC family protein [Alphaproteobacteria bacterium]|nr:VOC family protein [Alphaproteobacteria bacterium]